MRRRPAIRLWSPFRSFVKDEQGAVYTEAVITIPFFIMIWAFMIFAHQLTLDKMRGNSHAKGCTWAYAIGFCDRANLPAGCSPPVSFSNSAPDGWTRGSEVGDFLNRVGQVGAAVLGSVGYGQEQRSTARPNYIGGASTTTTARHSVSCNEKPKTARDLFSSLWDTIKSLF